MCKRTEGINKKRSQRNNRSEINFRANCDRTVRHYKGQSRKGEESVSHEVSRSTTRILLGYRPTLHWLVPPAAGAGFPVPAASWSLATCCHARGLPFFFIKVTTSFQELLSPYSLLLLTLKQCWVGLPSLTVGMGLPSALQYRLTVRKRLPSALQ